MGTRRASASVDQMRNEQKSARRGGECALGGAVKHAHERAERAGAGGNSGSNTGADSTNEDCVSKVVAAGCAGFCCGMTQDFIVAQQPGHLVTTGEPAMRMLHSCPRAGRGGAKSDSAISIANGSRINIYPLLARFELAVEFTAFDAPRLEATTVVNRLRSSRPRRLASWPDAPRQHKECE